MTLEPEIRHLFEVPQHRPAVAALIHHEFWTDVPGSSIEGMVRRLARASDPDRVPLALVALHDGAAIGAVNLVVSDSDRRPEWTPWLAGMVVASRWRGRGIGSALVRALLGHARRLAIQRVYLGTDGPGFYTRLGAVEHERLREDFWFMRFDLDGVPDRVPSRAGPARRGRA